MLLLVAPHVGNFWLVLGLEAHVVAPNAITAVPFLSFVFSHTWACSH